MEDIKKLPYMRTKEASEFLGINQTVLCNMAKEGRVPAFKFCNKWFFDKEKLLKHFENGINGGGND